MLAVFVFEDPFDIWTTTYPQRQKNFHQGDQLAFELLSGNCLDPPLCGVARVSDVTMT